MLKDEIEREKARIMIEFGGDIPDILDENFLQLTKKLVDGSVLAGVTTLDLDQKDEEQLNILKVKQKIEKENFMNTADREIEENAEIDKIRMGEAAQRKMQS